MKKSKLPSKKYMQEKILRVYNLASIPEISEGSSWYTVAHMEAERLSEKYKISITKAACIISALSPGCRWERNLIDAENLLTALSSGLPANKFKYITYGNNVNKAVLVYNSGTDKEALKLFAGPTSSKTRSFALNIINPDDESNITIDTHMINICGRGRIKLQLTSKQYRYIAEVYREVAKKLDIKPVCLQAILWITWRNLIEVNNKINYMRFMKNI